MEASILTIILIISIGFFDHHNKEMSKAPRVSRSPAITKECKEGLEEYRKEVNASEERIYRSIISLKDSLPR